MKKVFMTCASLMMLSIAALPVVHAASFTCPSPDQVRCVPAQTTVRVSSEDWKANGGQMTGNTFALNNQCANIIALPGSQNRLICCYTKCGVFFLDVPFSRCVKQGPANFTCN